MDGCLQRRMIHLLRVDTNRVHELLPLKGSSMQRWSHSGSGIELPLLVTGNQANQSPYKICTNVSSRRKGNMFTFSVKRSLIPANYSVA